MAGIVLMMLFAHSYLTVLVAVLLGVLLTGGLSQQVRSAPPRQYPS